MKFLRLVMSFGEVFALTPAKNRVRKVRTKVYAILVTAVLMVFSTASVVYYRQPLYANFSVIKLFLTIGMVVVLDLFNVYTVLAPVFCKGHQYRYLLKVLEDNQPVPAVERVPFYIKFLLPNVVYWGVNVYVAYVWTDILGSDYYKHYFVEVVQLYFQFYYNFFLCIVVKAFKRRYQHVNFLLSEHVFHLQMRKPLERLPGVMRRVETLVCTLNETVVTFNDLVGWPVLMTVVYSSMLLLNYLDDIFRNSFGYTESQYVGVVVSNVSVVFLTNVGTLVFILLCNAVLDEAKRTVMLCYKLRQYAAGHEREEVCRFVSLVKDNFPVFTAAGFFTISKTSVLHILSTVTTFFIIIVQFNTSGTVGMVKN